jgi:peptidoglycan/xylan/chitin deacetylase (PgdA/CDA1 family)
VRRAAGDAVRGDPGQAAARLAALARGRDPNDTFDELMAVSEARGLRSAFFFIAGGTPPLDGDYSLDDPWVRRLLRRIHERGHEIGLHGSYATMTDPGMLAGELERLRRACAEEGVEQERWGGRQHFLRWRCPDTWRAWDEAGLDVDSSLGFHDDAGFRCGTSHPFPVFDLERRRELRLREQPLVAMEVALLDRGSSSPAGAGARLRALKDACRRHGGAFTLLWHNSRYVSPRERRLYREALDAA